MKKRFWKWDTESGNELTICEHCSSLCYNAELIVFLCRWCWDDFVNVYRGEN